MKLELLRKHPSISEDFRNFVVRKEEDNQVSSSSEGQNQKLAPQDAAKKLEENEFWEIYKDDIEDLNQTEFLSQKGASEE